jgi:hypothetical protein
VNRRYLAIAKDPDIIPGVHHHCDEWCDHCPVTARCLAFRCTAEFRRQRRRRDDQPTFMSMEEAIGFTREIAAVEGTTTEELDALLANPPGESPVKTSDALAETAWDYSVTAAVFMMPFVDDIMRADSPPGRPSPGEIVLWDHLRIYMRVFRALVARDRRGARDDDAMGCAKSVLVAIERSRAALRMLRSEANAGEVDALVAKLEAIERGVDERFPHARSYLRLGLDCRVA